ncbi:MAG: helix-turn-helix domain-containing protein [Candidatus Dormibacteraceae bacterium]
MSRSSKVVVRERVRLDPRNRGIQAGLVVIERSQTDFTQPTGLGPVIGLSLRTLRAELGLTQEQVVEMLRAAGLEWTRDNVASLEIGRRQDLTITELVLLSIALDVPLRRWLQGHGPGHHYYIQIGGRRGDSAPVASLFTNTKPSVPSDVPLGFDPESIYLEAELHAAERLGIDPDELRESARRLWGKRLVDEREARLGSGRIAGIGSGISAAKRGHVTRQLLRELADAMKKEKKR